MKAQEELDIVTSQLQEKQEKLNIIEAKVCLNDRTTHVSDLLLRHFLQIAELESSYEQSVAEKESLTTNIEKTQARLKRAAKLTTGLADEQVRWTESVEVSHQSIGFNNLSQLYFIEI